jgi:transcription elongation GreA/GreB family factor
MNSIKEQLYKMCVDYVQKRINEARQAIADAQESADEETKSSAGDKYETGREMMQQETDRNQGQLNEANKLMVQLSGISYGTASASANPGSLVDTNLGKFFIAISAGTLSLGSQTYYAVSPASPIGVKLNGTKAGDEFSLNGRAYRVEKVA